MVNKIKVAKINSGSAVHLAEWSVSINGITGYGVACGSGKTGFKNQLKGVSNDTTKITCKKCLKAYNERYAGKTEAELNEMVQKDYDTTKAYAEKQNVEFRVTEELETAKPMTEEEELKYYKENNISFYLPKK